MIVDIAHVRRGLSTWYVCTTYMIFRPSLSLARVIERLSLCLSATLAWLPRSSHHRSPLVVCLPVFSAHFASHSSFSLLRTLYYEHIYSYIRIHSYCTVENNKKGSKLQRPCYDAGAYVYIYTYMNIDTTAFTNFL